jgi:uncharacterized membrane protein AbrB (regulator of aidB expression)
VFVIVLFFLMADSYNANYTFVSVCLLVRVSVSLFFLMADSYNANYTFVSVCLLVRVSVCACVHVNYFDSLFCWL